MRREKEKVRTCDFVSLFSFSTFAANFPCLVHMGRLLSGFIVKRDVLNTLRSTALGLVKARRQEGDSKVGTSLSLPVSKIICAWNLGCVHINTKWESS